MVGQAQARQGHVHAERGEVAKEGFVGSQRVGVLHTKTTPHIFALLSCGGPAAPCRGSFGTHVYCYSPIASFAAECLRTESERPTSPLGRPRCLESAAGFDTEVEVRRDHWQGDARIRRLRRRQVPYNT